MTNKMPWREWFALPNRHCWQSIDVPEKQLDAFKEHWSSTEAMYQAFKARFMEDTRLAELEAKGGSEGRG